MIKAKSTETKKGRIVNVRIRGELEETILEAYAILKDMVRMIDTNIEDKDEKIGAKMDLAGRIQEIASRIIDECGEEIGGFRISEMEEELMQKILESIQEKQDEDTEE